MTKKTKTWLIVGGILLAIVIISAVSGGDKNDGSQADTAAAVENTQAAVVEEEEEDDTLPIQTLIDAYEENEVAAKNEYQGKTFKFKGRISDIGVNPIGEEPYVTLDGNFLVNFYFSNSSVVAKLNKGDRIKLEGRVDSNLGTIIVVKKCKLVE